MLNILGLIIAGIIIGVICYVIFMIASNYAIMQYTKHYFSKISYIDSIKSYSVCKGYSWIALGVNTVLAFVILKLFTKWYLDSILIFTSAWIALVLALLIISVGYFRNEHDDEIRCKTLQMLPNIIEEYEQNNGITSVSKFKHYIRNNPDLKYVNTILFINLNYYVALITSIANRKISDKNGRRIVRKELEYIYYDYVTSFDNIAAEYYKKYVVETYSEDLKRMALQTRIWDLNDAYNNPEMKKYKDFFIGYTIKDFQPKTKILSQKDSLLLSMYDYALGKSVENVIDSQKLYTLQTMYKDYYVDPYSENVIANFQMTFQSELVNTSVESLLNDKKIKKLKAENGNDIFLALPPFQDNMNNNLIEGETLEVEL